MDATLFFTDTLGLTAQLVQSFGDQRWRRSGRSVRSAIFCVLLSITSTTHFHVRYTYLGDRFADNVNATGFVRDDNRRELDSAFEKTFWPAGSAFERVEYSSNYNIYWAANDSTLRSWQIDQGVEIDLRNRVSFEAAWQEEFILFEKGFRNRQFEVQVGYNKRAFEQVSIGYEWGPQLRRRFQTLERAEPHTRSPISYPPSTSYKHLTLGTRIRRMRTPGSTSCEPSSSSRLICS